MRDYPEQIENLQIEIADLNDAVQSLRTQIEHHEAVLTLDIVTAKDEAGKPLYSNESLRSAALVLAGEQSDELQKLRAEIRLRERERTLLFARLERLRLEYKLFLLDREKETKSL